MAASASINRNNVDDVSVIGPQVVNAAVLYAGAYQCINSRDHGTAASVGRVEPYTSTANMIPAGFQRAENKTGDTSASPIPRSNLWIGPVIVKSLAITGLAGTFADVGRVFYATADDTFTLTRTDPDLPLGIITDFQTSSVATARFFSAAELAILAMAGAGQATWLLGVVSGICSTGNAATGIVMPCHGRFTADYGIVIEPITDVDTNGDFNLEIGGTNVTGGVIDFDFADAIGVKKAGSAITAANVFHAGDLLDIECVETTAGTAADGYMAIYATVLMEPGL